jgi:hypothetical protein
LGVLFSGEGEVMKKKDKKREEMLLDLRDPSGRVLRGSDGLKVFSACEIIEKCKLKLSVLEETFNSISDEDRQIEPVCFGGGVALICHEMIHQLVDACEYLDATKSYGIGREEEDKYQASCADLSILDV